MKKLIHLSLALAIGATLTLTAGTLVACGGPQVVPLSLTDDPLCASDTKKNTATSTA